MHDHPMARRPSDMGTPSPNEMSAPPPPVKAGDDGRVGVEDPCKYFETSPLCPWAYTDDRCRKELHRAQSSWRRLLWDCVAM